MWIISSTLYYVHLLQKHVELAERHQEVLRLQRVAESAIARCRELREAAKREEETPPSADVVEEPVTRHIPAAWDKKKWGATWSVQQARLALVHVRQKRMDEQAHADQSKAEVRAWTGAPTINPSHSHTHASTL